MDFANVLLSGQKCRRLSLLSFGVRRNPPPDPSHIVTESLAAETSGGQESSLLPESRAGQLCPGLETSLSLLGRDRGLHCAPKEAAVP